MCSIRVYGLLTLIFLSGCSPRIFVAEDFAAITPATTDTTPPNAASSLSWGGSYSTSTTINAAWTVSNSSDAISQSVQLYTGSTCATTSGAPTVIADNTTATTPFTGVDGTTYSFRVTTSDSSGNSVTSACSGGVQIDATIPDAALGTWLNVVGANMVAHWTPSASSDVVSQTIQLHSDGTCTTASGPPTTFANNTTSTTNFTGVDGTTYSFKVESFDAAGNSAGADCSNFITRNSGDLTPPGGYVGTLAWGDLDGYAASTSNTPSKPFGTPSSNTFVTQLHLAGDCSADAVGAPEVDRNLMAGTTTKVYPATTGASYSYSITVVSPLGNTATQCSHSLGTSSGITGSLASGAYAGGTPPPWLAYVFIDYASRSDFHAMCLGVIHTNKAILVPAHCVNGIAVPRIKVMIDPNGWRDLYPASGAVAPQFFDAVAYTMHPDYGVLSLYGSDIAIIELQGPTFITMSADTQAAVIADGTAGTAHYSGLATGAEDAVANYSIGNSLSIVSIQERTSGPSLKYTDETIHSVLVEDPLNCSWCAAAPGGFTMNGKILTYNGAPRSNFVESNGILYDSGDGVAHGLSSQTHLATSGGLDSFIAFYKYYDWITLNTPP